jgi:hypothetical protein
METIKVNSLMLNDWVKIKEPDKYAGAIGTIQTLSSLEGAYLAIYINDPNFGTFVTEVFCEDIEPIPLTAEILEKNGLKPHRRYIGMFVERTDKYQLYVNKSNITAYILLEDGAEEHQWILPRPMYVHELQHAVKSFKINKEIVL